MEELFCYEYNLFCVFINYLNNINLIKFINYIIFIKQFKIDFD